MPDAALSIADFPRTEQLARIDWDFVDDASESPFSYFHWHPCRFVSQIPANLLGILCPPRGRVLDPFCGSGTSLVEAQRLGLESIGIDLNPVSCIISRAKTLTLSATQVERIATAACERVTKAVLQGQPGFAPASVQLQKWYSPGVSRQLTTMWASISPTTGFERDILMGAFSSILLSVCRETRHWGYVCDNTSPKDHREKDCLAEFKLRLDGLVSSYRRRDEYRLARAGAGASMSAAEIICGDAKEIGSRIPPESIDIVMTSPPYYGVADYIKSQRLSFEWFEYDIESNRLREIGARSKRHRQTAITDYNSEMRRVVDGIRTVLRPHGVAVMIMGESKARPGVVAEFKETVHASGFILQHELQRTISFRRRQHPSISEECILVFTRSE
jgi:DNA modification methylase